MRQKILPGSSLHIEIRSWRKNKPVQSHHNKRKSDKKRYGSWLSYSHNCHTSVWNNNLQQAIEQLLLKTVVWGRLWFISPGNVNFCVGKRWKGQGWIPFERQQSPFKDGQESKLASIITQASPLPQRSREITQRSHFTAHQALTNLLQSTDKRSEKEAFVCNFFCFQLEVSSCPSCVNLFTIPLVSCFLICLLLNPGYHYGREN